MNPAWALPPVRRHAITASKRSRVASKQCLKLAGDQPAILLGHGIGGMITLTFCHLFPSALGSRVSGLVLSHTTPTNPVRTTSGAAFFTAIEKPVLMPLMYLTVALSPLVWLMNWLMQDYKTKALHVNSGAPAVFRDENPGAAPDALYKAMFQCLRPKGMIAFHSRPR